MPVTIQGTGDMARNKMNENSCPHYVYMLKGEGKNRLQFKIKSMSGGQSGKD